MGRSKRSGGQGALSLLSFQDIITSLSGIMILLVLLLALDISPQQQQPSPPEPEKKQEKSDFFEAGLKIIGNRFDDLDPNDIYDIAEFKIGLEEIQSAQEKEQKQLVLILEKLKEKLKAITREKEDMTIIIEDLTAELEQLEKTEKEDNTPAVEGRDMGIIYTADSQKSRPLLAECAGTSIRAGFWDSNEPPETYSTDSSGQNNFINFLKTKEYVVFFIKPSAAEYAMDLIDRTRELGIDVGFDPMIEKDYVGNFGKPEGS